MSTLHVDWTACAARGACLELLPGVLRPDDWGYPRGEGGSDVALPPGSEAAAREAVALCPRLALTLRES
jgi:ferredoxin